MGLAGAGHDHANPRKGPVCPARWSSCQFYVHRVDSAVQGLETVPMRIVGYIRVSTRGQAEKGLGLDVQRRAIKSWAKANGHRVVAIHEDAGISGSNGVEDREGLPLALEDIQDGRAEALVILRLDRLARVLTVQEAILAKVWGMGAQVVSTESGTIERDDPDDPMRTALRQIMGVIAQLDRSMVVKRLRAGRQRKAELGGFAYGSPHYGTQAKDGELVSDDREQATLARIRQLREQGESLRKIAEVLTAEGHRPKRAARWHAESLRKIVARL